MQWILKLRSHSCKIDKNLRNQNYSWALRENLAQFVPKSPVIESTEFLRLCQINPSQDIASTARDWYTQNQHNF